jgi:hypothetical protein
MADFKKGKDQMGTRYNFQKDTPSDLLPQAWPYLLKFPQLSKVGPTSIQQMSLWRMFHI